MSVKARPVRKESMLKTQSHHLLATARVIVRTTRKGGKATENVMIEKDTKGLAFCGRRHPSISIDMYLEAVYTAAQGRKRANQRRTRRRRSTAIAIAIAKEIVTITKIADETVEAIDPTKGCEIVMAVAKGTETGTGSEAEVPIGETETSGLATEATDTTIETVTDDEPLYRLIVTSLGGESIRMVKVGDRHQLDHERLQGIGYGSSTIIM